MAIILYSLIDFLNAGGTHSSIVGSVVTLDCPRSKLIVSNSSMPHVKFDSYTRSVIESVIVAVAI